ncbi:hypothetical protein [Acinetobacter sp. WCHAc010052]|uniref:hypothetical protein n=1 Tax=Acinetobacter sp. WCHAc010052 TaxID=2004647 RepID=UPI000B3D1432|nr:hypothetical protein [Acinetobacter sp. WCHAc010052]AXY61000.1 hypothetical protein CDG61_13825 [Acinetobacter sp. WCHAc010052]
MPNFETNPFHLKDSINMEDPNDRITNKMSDAVLQELIEKALKGRKEEDIIWILLEFLNFKESSKNGFKRSYDKQNELKYFSSFNEIRQDLISLLKKLKSNEQIYDFFNKIENSKESLSETLIDIKNDKRICAFLFNYIKSKNRDIFYFHYEKNAYMSLVNWYFTVSLNTYRKDALIEKALTFFNTKVKITGKIHVTKLEDKDFSDWVYVYLEKKYNYFNETKYTQTNHKNDQLFITAYLDYCLYYSNTEYENLMNKVNKAWSQKKFRDGNKVKNHYHLPLTKKAKEELRKLSDFKNQSEATILEELIHQMFLKEMCDENGNSKY